MHTLGGIVCFGQVSCSPYLMGFCAENNVAVSFLSENGRFLAKVQGPVSGNVLLRREQYRRADDLKTSSLIARAIMPRMWFFYIKNFPNRGIFKPAILNSS